MRLSERAWQIVTALSMTAGGARWREPSPTPPS